MGRLLFNVLALLAEFESDLIKMRTREGMKVAKAKGRLRGKQPKLKPNQAKHHLLELHDSGNYTQAELAELLGVGRSTIYLVQPSNATVSRYGQCAESNQEARTFSRASSSLPPSRRPQDSCHATFPCQGLNSAMDRKRNAQRQCRPQADRPTEQSAGMASARRHAPGTAGAHMS